MFYDIALQLFCKFLKKISWILGLYSRTYRCQLFIESLSYVECYERIYLTFKAFLDLIHPREHTAGDFFMV